MRNRSAAAAVVVAAWALLGTVWAGPAGAYPAGTSASVSVSASCVEAGGTLGVFGEGFAPNAEVRLSLESDAVLLGFAQADASGALSASVTVPGGVSAGQHTLRADSATDSAFAAVQVGCGTAGGGGGGGLSETGVAVAGFGALAVALLAGGALLLLVGRRRVRHAG
jgi:hypothetical protein